MTTDPSIRDQSYAYFVQEAPELLQVLEQELLSLREDCSITKIHTLMRATHTLKGAAASVGLESIKTVAHYLEDIFRAICKPDVAIDSETEALLFEGYECLRTPLMAELSGTQANDSEVFERAATIFTRLQEKLGDCFGQEAYIPTSTELGFDMTQSIFEVGVTQRLEQIAEVLASEDPQEVASTLQTQAEVFLGLAESLNLSGFGAIARGTIAALAKHPDQALTIAQAALADFQQGQAAVLAGDRTSGGQVSPTLQQLAGIEAAEKAGGDEFINTLQIDDQFQVDQFQVDSLLSSVQDPELASVAADSLLEAIWITPESQQKQAATPPNSTPKKEPVSPSQTVRVNVEHLDRINYLVGELLTNQNRQSLQEEQLQGGIQELFSQLQQHQQMLSQLQDLSEQQTANNHQQLHSSEQDRCNQLYNLVQSLVKNAERLEAATEAIDLCSRQSSQIQEKQRLLFTSALDDLLAARMVPLGEIFNRLPRLLQQLETQHHKPAALKLSGTEILLDKAVAEKLYEPLLHLVRNAFDHGIEPIEVRQQSGKAKTGQIEIRAFHQGSHLTIEVRDDGQGINYARIRQRAVEQNLIASEQIQDLNEAQLMDLLFEPGFSTAEQVSNLSGRGVGLDVVRAQLQALQGAVTVYSEPHRGTTFILQVPFSLTMAKLLLCQAGSTTYAFLTSAIEQILIPQSDQIQCWEGGKVLRWGKDADERRISVCQLKQILNYLSPVTAPIAQEPTNQNSFATTQTMPILLLRCEDQLLGLEVEQIIGEQEMVIRPLASMIVPPGYVYGSSILAEGRLTLVIDGAALAKYVFAQYSSTRTDNALVNFNPPMLSANLPNRQLSAPADFELTATVLLVDDSPTQRQTLALTLQKFGYQVIQAGDGYEAIEQLRSQPDIQLVICDLEMPRMNGFEFLNYRREDLALAKIPVVILTSHSGEQQRLIAIELGATAYVNKPCLEQQILAIVADLLQKNQMDFLPS